MQTKHKKGKFANKAGKAKINELKTVFKLGGQKQQNIFKNINN